MSLLGPQPIVLLVGGLARVNYRKHVHFFLCNFRNFLQQEAYICKVFVAKGLLSPFFSLKGSLNKRKKGHDGGWRRGKNGGGACNCVSGWSGCIGGLDVPCDVGDSILS